MDAADGAFTADDNVDPIQRQESESTVIGEASVLAAEGGLDGKFAQVEESEETPLLGDNGSPRRRSEGPAAITSEWEGLPWYKRPSVSSSIHLPSSTTILNLIRCIGSSVPSSSLQSPLAA